jgi:hypothetical protein
VRETRRRQCRGCACYTCHSRCSSEFMKTFGILDLPEVMRLFASAHALERKPSNAWARKIPALTRPITAVTVSIIASFLYAPAAPNDCGAAQSKRFNCRNRRSGRVMICCNRLSESGTGQGPDWPAIAGSGPVISRPSAVTFGSPRGGSPHFRRVPDAISSCLGAEVGCIVG